MDRSTNSIYYYYNKCFADTDYLISGSKDQAQTVHNDSIAACLDVLARLRVWGDESKAELPPMTQGSLDDVLKNQPGMKQVVLRNLSRVQKNIQKCKSYVQFRYSPLTPSRCSESSDT